MQGAERVSSIPIILIPNPHLFKVQLGLACFYSCYVRPHLVSICNVSSSYSLNEVVDHVRAGFFIPGLQCWSHCTGYPSADGFCQSCQCLYSTAGVYYSISATLMLLVAILQSKLTISSVSRCMVTVLAPVLTLIFSRYWSKLHFDGQQMWCQTI